jgi:hypothetical protein
MHPILTASRRALFLAEQRSGEVRSALEAYRKACDIRRGKEKKNGDMHTKGLEGLEQVLLPISSTANQIRAARARGERASELNGPAIENSDALWSVYFDLLTKPLHLGLRREAPDESDVVDLTDGCLDGWESTDELLAGFSDPVFNE